MMTSRAATSAIDRSSRCLKFSDEGNQVKTPVIKRCLVHEHGELLRNPKFHFGLLQSAVALEAKQELWILKDLALWQLLL